jgi:predicted transcriptional regulator
LKIENGSKIFEISNNMLSGANGIVYLLFVGRQNYAANIQEPMTETLFADKSNVNQIIAKLLKEGSDFLISKGSYRKKGKRGRARNLYTANIDPITVTLKAFNIKFNDHELQFALDSLAETSDFFPKFLTNMYQTFIIRKLPWHGILSIYLYYLSEVLRANYPIVYPMPPNFSIKKEKVTPILQEHITLRKELRSISSQLSSPTLGLNPEFKAHMDNAMDQLDSKDSDARKVLKFLQGLRNEGITDFSALLSQVKEIRTTYEKVQQIKNKLEEVERKLNKLAKLFIMS